MENGTKNKLADARLLFGSRASVDDGDGTQEGGSKYLSLECVVGAEEQRAELEVSILGGDGVGQGLLEQVDRDRRVGWEQLPDGRGDAINAGLGSPEEAGQSIFEKALHM